MNKAPGLRGSGRLSNPQRRWRDPQDKYAKWAKIADSTMVAILLLEQKMLEYARCHKLDAQWFGWKTQLDQLYRLYRQQHNKASQYYHAMRKAESGGKA